MPRTSALNVVQDKSALFVSRSRVNIERSTDNELEEILRKTLLVCPNEACEQELENGIRLEYTVGVSDSYDLVSGDTDRQNEYDGDNYIYQCCECDSELDDDLLPNEIYNRWSSKLNRMGINSTRELIAYVQRL